MIVFALKPLDDELLSWNWARMAMRARLPISTLTTVLLGRKWTPGFLQSGHIEQTAGMLRMTPADLLLRHTVFGYATAFMKPDAYATAFETALAVGVEARKLGAVTQSVSDHTEFRRYCKCCAEEEVAAFGISYWHRSHNLPGVAVCLKHRTLLYQAKALPTRGRLTWTMVQPHQAAGDVIAAANPMRRRYLSKLAELSVAALERRHGTTQVADASWYRQELSRRRLLSAGRQLDGEALMSLVRRQMAGPVPAPIRKGDDESDDLRWLQLMVRPGVSVSFIPLKHLILQTALELSEGEPEFSLDFSPQGYLGKDKDRVDTESSAVLRVAVDRALECGSKLSIVQALKDAGCWQLYRHDSSRLPLVSAEVLRLRTSAASLRKTSVRRLIRQARQRSLRILVEAKCSF